MIIHVFCKSSKPEIVLVLICPLAEQFHVHRFYKTCESTLLRSLLPIFRFSFLVNFVKNLQKYKNVMQGKFGKMEKTGKKITQQKLPKYQKPKDKDMG